MSKRNLQEGAQGFETRVLVVQVLVLAIFIVLGIRFYVLQVQRHQEYTVRAENNRIREIPIIAARGQILDRNEKVLVDSTPAYNVVIYPEDMENRETTVQALVENLGLARDEVIKELTKLGRPKSEPILVKQNAGHADQVWIESHKEEHPEIDVIEQPQRIYPYGKTACHVLGYIGQISQKQLEDPKYLTYRQGDIIGQGGIEATYDKILRGKNGMRRVVVDSRGRPIRELEVIKPIKGQDIVTTLDIDLQRVAEEQFVKMNDKGAAVALDPRNGEILLLVSYPNFDPNVFARNVISPDNRKEVAEILLDPGHPLNNKAIQGFYPAGSTWKLMMSTAAIEEGITPLNNSRLVCGGGIQVGNRFVRCMGSHGSPDVHVAIVRSCDGYYYRLGIKMGVDKMNDWLQRFGMGVKTGIDLPHERAGSIPSRAWKARTFPRTPEWKDFDSVLASIGQGSVAISPHQLLRAEAGIMMGGRFYTPHIFKEARATYIIRDGETVEVEPVRHFEDAPKEMKLAEETVRAIRQAVWGVVQEGGTAGGLTPREWNVGGKTGTAQVIATAKAKGKHLQDHSWFISFAPIDKDTLPEIASVVFTENGGFGAKASGPKARAIYEAYFAKKKGQPIPAELLAKNETTADGARKAKPASNAAGNLLNRDVSKPQTAEPGGTTPGEQKTSVASAPVAALPSATGGRRNR